MGALRDGEPQAQWKGRGGTRADNLSTGLIIAYGVNSAQNVMSNSMLQKRLPEHSRTKSRS